MKTLIAEDTRACRAPRELVLGRHSLLRGDRPLIMGVLNLTPDSFFAGGRAFDPADPAVAAARAEQLVADGADLIDLGAQATAGRELDPAEEIARMVPVVRVLAARVAVPISVDTWKPQVALAAIEAGASLINDISGLADEGLATVAATTGAGIVCMHNRLLRPGPTDAVRAVLGFLRERTRIIRERGVGAERIVVDPGIGFGKDPLTSLQLVARLQEVRRLGYPVLFACSRSRLLGHLLDAPPEALLEATIAMNVTAVLRGADLLRVHDVRVTARASRMAELLRAAARQGR